MRFLFFDIECSNCFDNIGKICEFGYVLTDENFNIISKDDIPMNPGKNRGDRFHLTGRKGRKDLILAYEYNYYYSQEEFPYFYNRIKKLMEDENVICFAYSMKSDISFLYQNCKRYKLQPIKFRCYDTQLIVNEYLGNNDIKNLHNSFKAVCGPNAGMNLQEHLSRDDAMMEMMILEAICKLKNLSSAVILEKFKDFSCEDSVKYYEDIEQKKQQKIKSKEGFAYYRKIVAENCVDETDNSIKGRRYTIAGKIKENLDLLKLVINKVQKNGILVNNTLNADYFIVLDEKNLEEISEKLQLEKSFKFILLNDFLEN